MYQVLMIMMMMVSHDEFDKKSNCIFLQEHRGLLLRVQDFVLFGPFVRAPLCLGRRFFGLDRFVWSVLSGVGLDQQAGFGPSQS